MKNIITSLFTLLISFSIALAQTGNVVEGTQAAPNINNGDFNTIVGDSAGYSLTNASQSVFFGFAAGRNNSTQSLNVFLGYRAGFDNGLSSASDNVFIGSEAGLSNLTSDNVFIGQDAGKANTRGADNTFIGYRAGLVNINGRENTFVGVEAGYSNTSANENTFIGYRAGWLNTVGEGNTFIGGRSSVNILRYQEITGSGLGFGPGRSNVEGQYNTYLGSGAGARAEGTANTFIGFAAGANARQQSSECTFVGAFAGVDNGRNNLPGQGLRNTYLGYAVAEIDRDGNDNVGIGHEANFNNSNMRFNQRDVFIGNSSLIDNASDVLLIGHKGTIDNDGDFSVAIGNEVMVASRRSIGMGYNTDIAFGADDAVGIGQQVNIDQRQATALGAEASITGINSTAIGYQSSVVANNEIYIGNTAINSIGGSVNWTATSDARYKTDIREDVVGSAFIRRLRPVTYRYDALALHQKKGFSSQALATALEKKNNIRYSGFIAQEVEAAAHAVGYEFSGVKEPQNEEDIYGLRYAEFVVPLIKTVQELEVRIEKRSTEIEAMKAKLAKLEELEARLQALEVKKSVSYQKD